MISDLLASITGEKPQTSSSTPSRPLAVPKRKADNELPGSAAKTPRTTPVANGPGRQDVTKPSSNVSRLADRSVPSSSSNRPTSSAPRPNGDRASSSAAPRNTLTTTSQRNGTLSNGVRSGAAVSAPKRPSPVDTGPKSEPKKKSFAEIMARAAAGQAMIPQTLGKIQHKTIETGMSKRERDQIKLSEARKAAKLAKQGGAVKPVGTGAASRKPVNGAAASVRDTPGKSKKPAPVEEVKKVKKAALATTGYTGTARARPGATPGKPGATSRPGSTSARPPERSRYGGALAGPRRRRDEEEEDEDLDDFIEYDDEEEEPGYGRRGPGGYDSLDDESDMEAGLTDVEEEERRAERAAILEDRKEQELEARLKREKEERRRKEMAGRR